MLRMNSFLAFFHGEQALFAFGLSALIAVVTVPLVFYVWLRHTSSSERALTFTYAISTAILCGLSAFPPQDTVSVFQLTVFTLAGILTLPWNVITLIAVSLAVPNSDISDREIAVTMLLGAGVNAMILFFLAKRVKDLR
jgi:hypothetical protein